MAESKYSSILLYGSATPGSVPLAANLITSVKGVELAVNAADGKLFFKNASGVVTVLANSAFVDPSNVTITGGTVNGTAIGTTTAAAGSFTSLSSSAGLVLTSGASITSGGSAGLAGQVLTSAGPGVAPTWTTNGAGTVSSVAVSVPSFLSVVGSPITTSGTIELSYSGTALPVANGGTGTTTSTGTGSIVLSSSPTLVAPALGTPTSGVITNLSVASSKTALVALDTVLIKDSVTGTIKDITWIDAAASIAIPWDALTGTTNDVPFNTVTPGASGVGVLTWNNGDGTLDLGLKGGNVTLQIGQEEVILAVNSDAVPIVESQVVYVSGAQGNRVAVMLATNTTEAGADRTMGMATENIAVSGEGFVTTYGLVRQINTSAFAEGDVLYLGSTAGSITNVQPIAPVHSVRIGWVVRSHATVGSIFVDIANGSDLDDLHNVLINGKAQDDTLVYNSTTNLWANSSALTGKTPMTGFPVDSNGAYTCTLTYNETTRTVTLDPVSTSFVVFVLGVKYTFTGTQSIAHGTTYDGQFVYYNELGVLVTSTSPWDLLKHAPVAYVFWDSANSRALPFDERHHAGRDLYWHRNQHANEGTKVSSGFAASGYTLNDGSSDAAVTFAIATGRVEDEDIRIDTQALADGGPYSIIERVGAAGEWQLTRSSILPFLYTGNNLQYNQYTGSTWQRTAVPEDNYVVMYVFATTALPTTSITPTPTAMMQLIVIPGQTVYASQALALTESAANLSWGLMPFQEMAPLYKYVLRFNSTPPSQYTNTARCAIVDLARIQGSFTSITQAASTSAGSVTFVPTGGIAATDVQAALVELDGEKANLASPVFTGNVTGLGAATGTSFNAITGLTAALPLINGVAATGSSTLVARGDHVHPTDTSRLAATLTMSQLDTAVSDGNLVYQSQALGVPSSGTLTNATGLPIVGGTTGTLSLARGGTGAATQPDAANAILPNQIGQSGNVLTTNGTVVSWQPQATGSAYTRTTISPTPGATVLNVSYNIGYLNVFLNGFFLSVTDYTATDGTTIVFGVAFEASDLVDVISYSVVSVGVANALSGGVAGSVAYQTGSGITDMLAPTTEGYVLSSGTNPSWKLSNIQPVAAIVTNLDLSAAGYFVKTVTAPVTFTLSGIPAAGLGVRFTMEITNGGAFAVTFWAGVKWAGGIIPTFTVAGRDVLEFVSHDGSIWTGSVFALDAK